MSLFDLDLENVEEVQDFGACKPAPARVRVTEITEATSKAGKPGLKVQYDLVSTDGLEPLDGKSKISTKLSDWISLEANDPKHNGFLLSLFRKFIESFGLSWDSFRQNRDIHQLKGMEADVMLGLNDERTRNEISKYIVHKVTA